MAPGDGLRRRGGLRGDEYMGRQTHVIKISRDELRGRKLGLKLYNSNVNKHG
jgi:hypothetical protein